MSIGSILARHVADTAYADLPGSALAAAKRALVDTMAVAWAARGAPGMAETASGAAACGAGGDSTLWQTGTGAPARPAAFVNSVAASALDFDSVHPAAIHPDIVSVPAVLAVGQAAGCSGKEALCAVALCSDLLCRLALSTRGNSGWFYTSVYGAAAAGAVTAKLLGAAAEGIEHAMGLGFLNSSGTYQPVAERSLSKRALAAFATDAGVLCGYLASAGMPGPRSWIEGEYGLHAMYERGDAAPITEDLGVAYRNVDTAIKPYPSCQANHAPIDAMLALRARAPLAQIEAIEVVLTPYMNRLVGAPYDPSGNPQVAAQFSVRYSLACALVRGRLGVAEIREGVPLDPDLLTWARRVRIVVDESKAGNYCPATVRIVMRDGVVLSHTSSVLRGGVDAPLTEAELIEKLRVCLEAGGYSARGDDASAVYEALMRIEGAADVRTWMSDLTELVIEH